MSLTILDPQRELRLRRVAQALPDKQRRRVLRDVERLLTLQQLAPGLLSDALWGEPAFLLQLKGLPALDPATLRRRPAATRAALLDADALVLLGLAASRIGLANARFPELPRQALGVALRLERAWSTRGEDVDEPEGAAFDPIRLGRHFQYIEDEATLGDTPAPWMGLQPGWGLTRVRASRRQARVQLGFDGEATEVLLTQPPQREEALPRAARLPLQSAQAALGAEHSVVLPKHFAAPGWLSLMGPPAPLDSREELRRMWRRRGVRSLDALPVKTLGALPGPASGPLLLGPPTLLELRCAPTETDDGPVEIKWLARGADAVEVRFGDTSLVSKALESISSRRSVSSGTLTLEALDALTQLTLTPLWREQRGWSWTRTLASQLQAPGTLDGAEVRVHQSPDEAVEQLGPGAEFSVIVADLPRYGRVMAAKLIEMEDDIELSARAVEPGTDSIEWPLALLRGPERELLIQARGGEPVDLMLDPGARQLLRLRLELIDPTNGAVVQLAELPPLRCVNPRHVAPPPEEPPKPAPRVKALEVVLLRPGRVLQAGEEVEVDRLSARQAAEVVEQACRQLGWVTACLDLPVSPDALTLVDCSQGDAVLPQLLEQLARFSARCSGLEHALWLAILPEGAIQRPAVLGPSAGAQRLVVATPSQLPGCLDELTPTQAGERCVRFTGWLGARLHLDPPRPGLCWGPTALPERTELRIETLNDAGQVIGSRPLTALRRPAPGRRLHVEATLPICEEVRGLRLMRGEQLLRRWTPQDGCLGATVLERRVASPNARRGAAWIPTFDPAEEEGPRAWALHGAEALRDAAHGPWSSELRERAAPESTARPPRLVPTGDGRLVAIRDTPDEAGAWTEPVDWVHRHAGLRRQRGTGAVLPLPDEGVVEAQGRTPGAKQDQRAPRRPRRPGIHLAPPYRPVLLILPSAMRGDALEPGVSQAEAARALKMEALHPKAPFLLLPWVPDALAVLPAPIEGSDSPGVEALLGALARLALSSPGLEDVLLLALVPGEAPWLHSASAPGAWRVGVATPEGARDFLPALMSGHGQEPYHQEVNALRVVVDLNANGLPGAPRVRRDRRPLPTGDTSNLSPDLRIVAQGQGGELHSQALSRWEGSEGATLMALLPEPDDLRSLELWQGDKMLRRVAFDPLSPTSAVEVHRAEANADLIRWRFPSGLRPELQQIELELEAPEAWGERPPIQVPILRLPGGARSALLPRRSLSAPCTLRLRAVRRWDSHLSPPLRWTGAEIVGLSARELGGERFLATVEQPAKPAPGVRWQVNGVWLRGALIAPNGPLQSLRLEGIELLSKQDTQQMGPSVVLFRPAVCSPDGQLTRLDRARIEEALEEGLGALPNLVELPIVPDALTVIHGEPRSGDDVTVHALLGAAALEATRCPGGEESVWLVVLPGASAWSRQRETSAARAVIVASIAGLRQLRALPTPQNPGEHQRALRVIGEIDAQRRARVTELRVEERLIRPIPEQTHHLRVTLVHDPPGPTMESHLELEGSQHTSIHFFGLVPCKEDVRSLDLHYGYRVVERRLRGMGTVVPPAPFWSSPRQLTWTLNQPGAPQRESFIELERAGVRCPAARLRTPQDTWRPETLQVGEFDRVHVVVSDGWNSAEGDTTPPPDGSEGDRQALLRTTPEGLWLDTGARTPQRVIWELSALTGGELNTPSGPHLRLPHTHVGQVRAYPIFDDHQSLITLSGAPLPKTLPCSALLVLENGALLCAGVDRVLRLYPPGAAAPSWELPVSRPITRLAAQGGATLAWAGEDGRVGRGPLLDPQQHEVYYVGQGPLRALRFMGSELYFIDNGGTIWRWSEDEARPRRMDDAPPKAQALTPGGPPLLSVHETEIALHDGPSGRTHRWRLPHTPRDLAPLVTAARHPDGGEVWALGGTRLWRMSAKLPVPEVGTLGFEAQSPLIALGWQDDAAWVAEQRGQVLRWSEPDAAPRAVPLDHEIVEVAQSPDGQRLALLGHMGRVSVLTLRGDGELARHHLGRPVSSLQWRGEDLILRVAPPEARFNRSTWGA